MLPVRWRARASSLSVPCVSAPFARLCARWGEAPWRPGALRAKRGVPPSADDDRHVPARRLRLYMSDKHSIYTLYTVDKGNDEGSTPPFCAGACSGADARVPSPHASAASSLEIVAKGPISMTLFAIGTLPLTQNAIGTLIARGKRARARMREMPTRQNANRRSIKATGRCPYRQKRHEWGLFSCKEGVRHV